MKYIILFLLLFGCDYPYIHGNWNGIMCMDSQTLNNEEMEMILSSINEWNEKSQHFVNMSATINQDENCDCFIKKGRLSGKEVGKTYRPFFEGDSVKIVLSSLLPEEDEIQKNIWRENVLHELGHYLGVNHSPNKSDVMFCKINRVFNLTDGDINQLWHPYPEGEYDCPIN